MISDIADGKSANFYTIKLWREAPTFLYYQTFAETECGKVILSNFRSDPNRKKPYYQTSPPKAVNFFFDTFFQNQRFAYTYIVKIS